MMSKGDLSKAHDYLLRGVTYGFIDKQLDVVKNKMACGILARSWPEWLTIDTILNISITWICLQDQHFSKSLASLLTSITFL
jgi:hypothetical protein